MKRFWAFFTSSWFLFILYTVNPPNNSLQLTISSSKRICRWYLAEEVLICALIASCVRYIGPSSNKIFMSFNRALDPNSVSISNFLQLHQQFSKTLRSRSPRISNNISKYRSSSSIVMSISFESVFWNLFRSNNLMKIIASMTPLK